MDRLPKELLASLQKKGQLRFVFKGDGKCLLSTL